MTTRDPARTFARVKEMPILTPCTPEGSLRCHRVDGPGISDPAGNAWELAEWLRASGLLS